MGPVTVCGPRPGKSVRSFLISSMVRPGTTWLCECIIVSITTLSPESTRSTGACALSNQPHCVVSMVAGSTWSLPFMPLAGTTACDNAAAGTRAASAAANGFRFTWSPGRGTCGEILHGVAHEIRYYGCGMAGGL